MSSIVLTPHMAMAKSGSFFRISKMRRTPFSPSTEVAPPFRTVWRLS